MAINIVDLGSESYDRFDVYFYDDRIQTLVTHEPHKVVDWIAKIEYIHRHRLDRLIVGLDVEWRPNTARYQNNPVATLQLCVGRRCLIFQLLYCCHIPFELADFLSHPDYTFVGVGIHNDIQKLVEDYDLEVNNAVDLCYLAANDSNDRSLRNVGLKDLAMIYLGAEMSKPRRVRLSRWDQSWLTEEQIQYACVDAFVSFEIGRVLEASEF
ncbi:PREDICTED: Werner Syndrome-like exonuclease [Ipomoea nil]|uniref:Werner Syndrome-like exonuclease n=1 Tax=Ipomoea nil TaxID=35883 RepID=UPI000900F5EA|nr:PREDICTED: Werner Syndrome-like exonuclease [Ipomoea nil]